MSPTVSCCVRTVPYRIVLYCPVWCACCTISECFSNKREKEKRNSSSLVLVIVCDVRISHKYSRILNPVELKIGVMHIRSIYIYVFSDVPTCLFRRKFLKVVGIPFLFRLRVPTPSPRNGRYGPGQCYVYADPQRTLGYTAAQYERSTCTVVTWECVSCTRDSPR